MAVFNKNKDAFILSDGTVQNSYGFYIATSGIDLKRFSANPVMLDSHINGNSNVIGNWYDLTVDEQHDRLMGKPNFDTQDPDAERIAGKVRRGFIKGASIGISFERNDLKKIDGKLVLTKCELIEVSIVAIPSNANALKLYCNNEELNREAVAELCLSVSSESNNENISENENKNNNMSKQTIVLGLSTMAVLGFKDPGQDITNEQIEKAVLELGKLNLALESERNTLKEKLESYEAKEKAEKTALSTKLVDDAIRAGKITADKRDAFLNMAVADYDSAKEIIDAIPGKDSYRKGLKTDGGTITMDEFQKLDLAAQLKFKSENPEGYKALVG